MIKFIRTCFLLIALAGCSPNEKNRVKESMKEGMEFASKFTLDNSGEVTVLEPWPGAAAPHVYSFNKVPERVVVTSTTHLPFLELLGIEDKLVGFPGTQYISSEKINERIKSGEIAEVGVDGKLNLELLIQADPDLVIAFDMGGESAQLDKIEEAGIQVIYNSDFLETSALGRAEWIKFFGAIFDKSTEADSIFDEISTTYESLTSLTSTVDDRPTVFTGILYGDTWYMPGGGNWSAKFYQDAGANYLWGDNANTGWLELSFESVFAAANNADYWVGIGTFNTLDELAAQDARYADFNAFANGTYSYNKRVGPGGGFDYMESGYARPDIVLADLISIFHPRLLPDYQRYYHQKII